MNALLFVYSVLDREVCIIHLLWQERQQSRTQALENMKKKSKDEGSLKKTNANWFPRQTDVLIDGNWPSVCAAAHWPVGLISRLYSKYIRLTGKSEANKINLCFPFSPEKGFPAGPERCGGGSWWTCCVWVCASRRIPRTHRVLETQRLSNQHRGKRRLCELT